jgi:hypothetical protein
VDHSVDLNFFDNISLPLSPLRMLDLAELIASRMGCNPWKRYPQAVAIVFNAGKTGDILAAAKVFVEFRSIHPDHSLDLWNEEAQSLVYIVSSHSQWGFLDWMLSQGADVNYYDGEGLTPLVGDHSDPKFLSWY